MAMAPSEEDDQPLHQPRPPRIQVIILGAGGGPLEDNTTAFLVRSIATGWKKGSMLAVDAGTHLASIAKIIEKHLPADTDAGPQRPLVLTSGPFKGLELPAVKASTNAGHITHTMIDTFLITHPHIDHISGFVVSTASGGGTRPKRLAGLPSTIEAFKNHIFNNIIWPNLSDENNGAGLVTYMRMVDGGSPAIGTGGGKGYVELCDGLSVKTLSVSHGTCIENHVHRGSNAGLEDSRGHSVASQFPVLPRSNSASNLGPTDTPRLDNRKDACVVESSAYFIRDVETGREVIIFGDVEPDSISLSARNKNVWKEAAPKISSGKLGAILIECSYDDSRNEKDLYGHLAPRYLIEELKNLAAELYMFNFQKENKKRKRLGNGHNPDGTRRRSSRISLDRHSPISPMTRPNLPGTRLSGESIGVQMEESEVPPFDGTSISLRGRVDQPLKGLKIVIIHLKDTLNDGPDLGTTILRELCEYEEEARLGCEFSIAKFGESVFV
ncbi:hypothetical protein G7Y89_g6326 [Cudoniella acicularis]|uniref:3',5'-cyclic-nucleotide phosphodiesterase n=1 Tax=Cudoniella acicularis TaxID=354080 RepID=A0A8H4RKN4_9HELO|nr:hypothetical protein G7Y89_g6326 [Cudoniella acicularis]